MAHLIDETTGKAAFVSIGEPGWHGLGKLYKDRSKPLTARQVLEDGGLDFYVIKMPNVHILPDRDDRSKLIQVVSKDSFYTFRTDTCQPLGTRLGADYKELQNIDALDIVDEILQSGTATIETAGAIDEGKKVFICLKINKDIFINGTDVVQQYILVATSHDASISTTIFPTNIRVVCNNTLSAALGAAQGAIKIRHTSNAKQKLADAARVLKLLANNAEANTENYSIMSSTKISQEMLSDYFYNVFCTPEQLAGIMAGKEDALKSQKLDVLKDVDNFHRTGVGQKEALKNGLNMWSAYNAVTGYVTRKNYTNVNERAKSMMFGTSADYIKSAGILALEPKKILPIKRKLITALN